MPRFPEESPKDGGSNPQETMWVILFKILVFKILFLMLYFVYYLCFSIRAVIQRTEGDAAYARDLRNYSLQRRQYREGQVAFLERIEEENAEEAGEERPRQLYSIREQDEHED